MSSTGYEESVSVEVVVHIDGSRTFTVVTTDIEKGTFKGFGGLGASKRNTTDPVDFNTGYKLAFARALRDLADNLDNNRTR